MIFIISLCFAKSVTIKRDLFTVSQLFQKIIGSKFLVETQQREHHPLQKIHPLPTQVLLWEQRCALCLLHNYGEKVKEKGC